MENTIVLVHGLFGTLNISKILTGFGNSDVFTLDLLGYGAEVSVLVEGMSLMDQANHHNVRINRNTAYPVHLAVLP